MIDRSRVTGGIAGLRRSFTRRPATAGAIGAAAFAGLVSWLVIQHGGDRLRAAPAPSPLTTTTTSNAYSPVGPLSLNGRGLKVAVASLGQPVYWAGPQPGKRYGLTRNGKGDVFLRYLPSGVSADVQERLLTFGTYRFPGAYAATQRLTKQPGAVSRRLVDGGLVYYRTDHPVSVYLVYPKVNYQIEVFSPSPMQARHLVLSGRVHPIG